MTITTIALEHDRVRLVPGLLRAQPVAAPAGWTRIGLIATTALLLGGDEVELDIRLGPRTKLHLFDVGGTVAYNGRGAAASLAYPHHPGRGCGVQLGG